MKLPTAEKIKIVFTLAIFLGSYFLFFNINNSHSSTLFMTSFITVLNFCLLFGTTLGEALQERKLRKEYVNRESLEGEPVNREGYTAKTEVEPSIGFNFTRPGSWAFIILLNAMVIGGMLYGQLS